MAAAHVGKAHVLVAALLLWPARSMHVGLYIGAWLDAANPSSASYFDIANTNLSGVTHLYYAFVLMRGPPSFELHDDVYGNLPNVLRARDHNPALQVLISIGGGSFDPKLFSAMAASPASRAKFVASVRDWVLRYRLDGVDLDWESPVAKDRTNFVALVSELRAMLDGLGPAPTTGGRYALTAATGSSPREQDYVGYDLKGLSAAGMDYFNIMAYDMHDPCYGETATRCHTAWSDCLAAINFYKAKGVPTSKMVLGLAFYGHGYNLTDAAVYQYEAPAVEELNCQPKDTPSYADLMSDLAASGGSVFVSGAERCAYYVHDERWVGFEVEETLWAKMQGAQELGLAGVMAWEVLSDTHDHRLLDVLRSSQPPPLRACGRGFPGNGRCPAASQCCSLWGYCGVSGYECGPGCRSGPCTPYAYPPPAPPPTPPPPPLCDGGSVGSGACLYPDQCCSRYGYCGQGGDYCGENCVGGACQSPLRRTSPPPPRLRPPPPMPHLSPRPPPPMPQPSPRPPPLGSPSLLRPAGGSAGSCGGGHIKSGSCEEAGTCCSSAGYCGRTTDYCGHGCQGGACWAMPPPPPGQVGPPTCGNGKVGNKRCSDPGACCSAYGYCQNTPEHCGDACVGGNCYRWRSGSSSDAASGGGGNSARHPPPPPPKRRRKLHGVGPRPGKA